MIDLDALERIRKQRNISQEVIALSLGFKGKSGYNNLVRGKSKRITPERITKIKNVLKLSDEQVNKIFFAEEVKETRTA